MYIRTPEIRLKISEALKKAHKNKPGKWRKDYSCTDELRKKMSEKYKGRKLSAEWIEKRTKSQRGLKRSLETRKKISQAKKGENSPLWKGGVSKKNNSERKIFMSSFEYREWRRSVFVRDNYTCVFCKVKGGSLHADHIKPYLLYPDLRLSLENGRTLCVDCHRKTPTWGSRVYKK